MHVPPRGPGKPPLPCRHIALNQDGTCVAVCTGEGLRVYRLGREARPFFSPEGKRVKAAAAARAERGSDARDRVID